MKLKRNPCGDVMVIELSGKIPCDRSHQNLHGEIRGLIAEGYRKVLLDFRRVNWISSNGIGLIIGSYHSLSRAGGKMKLCRLNQRSLSIFYVCQLQLVFDIYDKREDALAAFAEAVAAVS